MGDDIHWAVSVAHGEFGDAVVFAKVPTGWLGKWTKLGVVPDWFDSFLASHDCSAIEMSVIDAVGSNAFTIGAAA